MANRRIFHPIRIEGTDLLENIQNSFTRKLTIGCFPGSYDMTRNRASVIWTIGLISLMSRRKRVVFCLNFSSKSSATTQHNSWTGSWWDPSEESSNSVHQSRSQDLEQISQLIEPLQNWTCFLIDTTVHMMTMSTHVCSRAIACWCFQMWL